MMYYMTNPSAQYSWYTAEIQHAERVLDAAIDGAAATLRRSDELLAELEATEEPATEEEIEGLRALLTGRGRTPEVEVLLDRIARGEFTWRDLAEGRLALDPGVQAAFESLRGLPALSPERKDESDQNTAHADTARPMVSDDEYFEDFNPLGNY